MRKPFTTSVLACLAALGALPGLADARKDQRSVIQDDARLIAGNTSVRNATLDEMKSLGADMVKITIEWRNVAPGSKPANPADPAAYPAAKWKPYDEAIQGAQARGLEVFLNVAGPAPDWAVSGKSNPDGVYRPDPAQFGEFVKAVGTRYSGSYGGSGGPGGGGTPGGGGGGGGGGCPIPGIPCDQARQAVAAVAGGEAPAAQAAQTAPLPAVRIWSVWNEPNLPRFLLPQRSSNRSRTPVSPHVYRRLYLAAHGALSGTGHGGDTILIGELLPVGRSSRTTRSSIRPIEFLRELACLDSRYRPFKGSAARARGCRGFKAIPGTGLAFHPYTLAGGPSVRPRHRDDASISTLSRLTKALDRLSSRKRLVVRRMPLFLTEFGFQTDPPDRFFGAPLARVPGYMNYSERLTWANSRVMTYSQYPLVDDGNTAGFQSGLRFADGRPKPGIHLAYRMPIWTRRAGSRTEVFGAVRAADSGTVTIESRRGKGKWKKVGTASIRARGYFRRVVRVNGKGRQFRFAFGGARSRVTSP